MIRYTAILGPGSAVNKSVTKYPVFNEHGEEIGIILASTREVASVCELSLDWLSLRERRMSHVLGLIRQLIARHPQATIFIGIRPESSKVSRRIPIAGIHRRERFPSVGEQHGQDNGITSKELRSSDGGSQSS